MCSVGRLVGERCLDGHDPAGAMSSSHGVTEEVRFQSLGLTSPRFRRILAMKVSVAFGIQFVIPIFGLALLPNVFRWIWRDSE